MKEVSEKFTEALQSYYPGALPLHSYMMETYQKLNPLGFNADNTFACVSVCRDEITKPMIDETDNVWGEVFNFSSLAGSLTLGKTGFGAAAAHAPTDEDIERYVFIAMPHIAISDNGEVGIVYREGIDKPSHACGALCAIIDEIESGSLKLQLDMDDLEQSVLKSKICEKIVYGEKPDLFRITQITHDIIKEDLERLIKITDKDPFDYAVLTGVMIHGPNDTNFVHPQGFYTVTQENGRTELKL